MVDAELPSGKVTYSSKKKTEREIHRGFMFKDRVGRWKNPDGNRFVSDDTANHYNAQRRYALTVADSWRTLKTERADIAKRLGWNNFQKSMRKVEKIAGKQIGGEEGKGRIVRSSDPVLLMRNLAKALGRRGIKGDERDRLIQSILEETTIDDNYSPGRRKFNIYGVGY